MGIPMCSEWREGKYYFEKIGQSLMSKFPQDQDEQLWRYIQAQLLEGVPPPSRWSRDGRSNGPQQQPSGQGGLTIQPAHQQSSNPAPPPPAHQSPQVIQGRKPSGEEEEIDDDEEQAPAQRTNSTEHGLITISQYSPSTGTQMTFTRAPQGGQPVTLSIQETSGPQSYPEPLVLTTNGLRQHSEQGEGAGGQEGQRDEEEEEEGPINFSSSRRRDEEG